MRGTGQFGNYVVPQEEDSFDKKVRQLHANEVPAHSTEFDDISADEWSQVVSKVAQSNEERQAEAISKADSASFLASHPEFIDTPANQKVINKLLQAWGLFKNTTYPDLIRAYEFALGAQLLEIDKAEIAKQQDHPLTSFKGLTGKTYDNVDALIANNRKFALEHMPAPTEGEKAFENIPQEQVLTMLKQGERIEQCKANLSKTVRAIDVWAATRPEFIASERNVRLLWQQMSVNGVREDEATPEDFEVAYRELAPSGLFSLNKQSVAKQHRDELKQLAADAVAEGGSVWDESTEIDMETMDLSELRNRANKVLARG